MSEDLTWFWAIVDKEGFADVPSSEIDALQILSQKASERDALREELAAYRARKPVVYSPDAQAMSDRVKAAEAERDALREENARLREALGPFAEMLKGNYSHQSDDMPIKAGANQYDLVFVFTLGDLRAAAAAIREGGKDDI